MLDVLKRKSAGKTVVPSLPSVVPNDNPQYKIYADLTPGQLAQAADAAFSLILPKYVAAIEDRVTEENPRFRAREEDAGKFKRVIRELVDEAAGMSEPPDISKLPTFLQRDILQLAAVKRGNGSPNSDLEIEMADLERRVVHDSRDFVNSISFLAQSLRDECTRRFRK